MARAAEPFKPDLQSLHTDFTKQLRRQSKEHTESMRFDRIPQKILKYQPKIK
jgi:hypothetical protein